MKHGRTIVTADARSARLYECTKTPAGRWHAAEHDAIHNEWTERIEPGRPTVLARGPSASAAQRSADRKHEAEEMDRRFARSVARWIAETPSGNGRPPLTVFAAPRFFARLRDELDRTGVACILREGEFVHLLAPDLVRHPTILECLEP
ncbi:MAG: host attachment protein [Phycisphaeraceae bacterium]|nr:host attachment protein [Phycisphaeraceae bacterium]